MSVDEMAEPYNLACTVKRPEVDFEPVDRFPGRANFRLHPAHHRHLIVPLEERDQIEACDFELLVDDSEEIGDMRYSFTRRKPRDTVILDEVVLPRNVLGQLAEELSARHLHRKPGRWPRWFLGWSAALSSQLSYSGFAIRPFSSFMIV